MYFNGNRASKLMDLFPYSLDTCHSIHFNQTVSQFPIFPTVVDFIKVHSKFKINLCQILNLYFLRPTCLHFSKYRMMYVPKYLLYLDQNYLNNIYN